MFVVDAAGIAHERDVKVGAAARDGVEITEGLKAGERVVTYGAYGVEDSAKVVPLERRRKRPAKPERRTSRDRGEALAVRRCSRAAALRLSGDRAC